jgi:hypothetical protein
MLGSTAAAGSPRLRQPHITSLNPMGLTTKFVPLEELDPDAARRLPPGVHLRVSVRTFAQVAAERLRKKSPGSDSSSKFLSIEEFDPTVARQLLPGTSMRVSRRTFAEVAAERFRALQGLRAVDTAAATPTGPLTPEEVHQLFALVAARPLPADSE